MHKKGFTLVELIIVIAIIAILLTMVIGGCRVTTTAFDETFKAELVRKYEVVKDDNTIYRVDVRRPNQKEVETMENHDNWWRGKKNTATLYANLAEGKCYVWHTSGSRSEWMSWFPNVLSAEETNCPEEETKGEISY